MNRCASLPRPHAGFSLIELVFALLLLGILAGLAFPSFTQWVNRTRLESALNEVAADIAFTRMTAVRANQAATFEFQNGGREYVITVNGRTRKRVDLRAEYPGLTVEIAPAGALTFNSRGLVQGAGRTVTAQRSGRQARMTVSPVGRTYREF